MPLLTFVVFGLAMLPAQEVADPEKALKEIAEVRKAATKEVRPGFFEFDQEPPRKRAKEIVKGLDPHKLDAGKGDLWAKVFVEAEDYPAAILLAKRFVKQSKDEGRRCDALLSAVQSAAISRQSSEIWDLTKGCHPIDAKQMQTYDYVVGSRAVLALLLTEGAGKASEYLKSVCDSAPWKGAGLDESGQISYAVKFGGLLAHFQGLSGKPEQGLTTLQKISPVPAPGSEEETILNRRRNELSMIGKPAKLLSAEKAYGKLLDLDRLKGKVVLLDFYAHWCGPCIATFEKTKKMRDELRPQGLEIIGVTRDWGYFGAERNVTPEVEREKLAGFLQKYGLPWPTALVGKARMQEFGVMFLPTVILIDRKGIVRMVDEHFYMASLADPQYLERTIKKLLAEKA